MAKYQVDIDKTTLGEATRLDFEYFFEDIKEYAFPRDLNRQLELFKMILSVHSEDELRLGLKDFLARSFVTSETLEKNLQEPGYIAYFFGARPTYTRDAEVPYPLPDCQSQYNMVSTTVENIIRYCYEEQKIGNDLKVIVPAYRLLSEKKAELEKDDTQDNMLRINEIEDELQAYRNQASEEVKAIANSMLEEIIQSTHILIKERAIQEKQDAIIAKQLQQEELDQQKREFKQRQANEEQQNYRFLHMNPDLVEREEEKQELEKHPIVLPPLRTWQTVPLGLSSIIGYPNRQTYSSPHLLIRQNVIPFQPLPTDISMLALISVAAVMSLQGGFNPDRPYQSHRVEDGERLPSSSIPHSPDSDSFQQRELSRRDTRGNISQHK